MGKWRDSLNFVRSRSKLNIRRMSRDIRPKRLQNRVLTNLRTPEVLLMPTILRN